MKLLVVGAAGRTGRAVVARAVNAGHDVSVVVRRPTELGIPDVRVHVGDATDPATIEAAVTCQDAVISTVGGTTPYRHTTLETDVATTLTAAMQQHGVRRLVVTSSLGVGDSTANTPFFVRIVVATFLRGSTRDKARMESVVRSSDLDWVITRPAVLTDRPATDRVRVLTTGSREKARGLTRADLATFLLAQLTVDDNLGRAVTLADH